jgi:hypothetical protein
LPEARQAHNRRYGFALLMALVALPIASGRLRAQDAPDPWPTDDPNESQPSRPYQYSLPQYQQPQYPQSYPQQAYPDPNQPYPQPQLSLQPPGFSAEQLERMVAPIALYPDNLVSIVLAASTYPAEVVEADEWLRMQGNAPPEQIAAGANAQSDWDPSVKALTAFPQVLDQLAQNLQWTTDLGNAYYNQPQDVMQTVQVMRARAQVAGTLQNTPQQQVTTDQGYIELAPPSPQIVYVPSYNPWVVYGAPVPQYPGYDWLGAVGSFFGGAFIQWGPGIAMQAFAVTPFGWLGWGLNWFGHAVIFNRSAYCTHSYEVRDWGFAHGGPRGFHGWERGGFRDARGWGREDFLRAGRSHFGLPQQGYNHEPQAIARLQQGDRRPQNYGGASLSYQGRPSSGATRNYGSLHGSGYGSNTYGRNFPGYTGRTGSGYSTPAYRAPISPRAPTSRSFGYRFGQYGYGGPNEHSSGGYRQFGEGRQSNSFSYGSNRAPKSYNFGGGHSSWGGGSYRAPNPSHFSGGGGHFGGGGYSSGSHGNHH